MAVSEETSVQEGWSRRSQRLPRRRAIVEATLGGAFVAAAVALAVLADADRDFELGPAVVLVAMFALGIRVRIDVGVGYTSPVQLAFVPMLLVLPTPYVPLLVLLAWLLGRAPDLLRSDDRLHPNRLLIIPTDCWFALGPALVLVLGDAQTPDGSDWPVYLLALAAQFALEAVSSYVRDRIGEGVASEVISRELALVWGIDLMLSPLGLLAAFSIDEFEYAFILLVPPAALIGFYARERTRRLEAALALADTARDRQHLVAGASHELVTPLAVLVGLTDRLTRSPNMGGARREQVDAVMRREVLALRQVVRQFVDYTRLKTERDLTLRSEPVELGAVAESVVVALESSGRLLLIGPPEAPPAMIDPDRAHQMVTSLAALALEGTDGARLEISATDEQVRVVVTSAIPPPERPFAEGGEGTAGGLGLYVTRELARRQGGEVTAEATPDGGARYVLTVPRAR